MFLKVCSQKWTVFTGTGNPKNHITLGENCTMASTNPVVSDSIYMDRLSRIPSIIEMPYNEAVRKFIDMYAVRLRNKVSFMLAATNFYMLSLKKHLIYTTFLKN